MNFNLKKCKRLRVRVRKKEKKNKKIRYSIKKNVLISFKTSYQFSFLSQCLMFY